MKTKFLFFALAISFLCSCNTARVALDRENTFGVAPSVPQATLPTDMHALQGVPSIKLEPATLSTGDISVANTQIPMVAMNTAGQTETEKQITAAMIANDLRKLSTETESRFAGRILNKTADRIEASELQKKEKLTVFDKIKKKLSEKFVARYAKKLAPRMDVADILAISALCAGGVALIGYYGSFLFGVAGIVLGAIALRRGTSRRGMAIAGIALGAVAIFLWILLFTVVISVSAV